MDIDHSLTDPRFFISGDPHSLWLQLRREDPVHWTIGKFITTGYWLITRHADAVTVYGDTNTYSSAQGIHVPSRPEFENITLEQQGCNMSIAMTDPPLHGAMRRAFNRFFLPQAVARFESFGARVVDEMLGEVLASGECDFVSDIAAKLPMAFICEILGIPREDWASIYGWANMALGYEDPEYQIGSAVETRYQGSKRIFDYCAKLALKRRGGGGNDLLSVMGDAEINGRKLTAQELGHNGLAFVTGGVETTRNAASAGLLALIRHPEQRKRLSSDPGLLPTAIEEILRWTSPVTQMMRTVVQDTELGGRALRRGDRVVVCNASANRDEGVFDNPYTFDIARHPNEHLAFGRGPHFCIGAHVARLELKLIVRGILEHMEDIRLAGTAERLRSNFLAGIKHMPIKFTARTIKN